MERAKRPIGVMDSGAGGITVLSALLRELPCERFLFYGDSANAPYGDKDPATILKLTRSVVRHLLERDCKAVVIACNTATSAAAGPLRSEFPHVPIVGIEPALKPAALAAGSGTVLVMATAATLQLEKFHELASHWGSAAHVVEIPCPGLVELIERGDPASPAIGVYLRERIGHLRGQVDGVVLGCTHYPLVKDAIAKVLGPVAFFDGAAGTARQTAHVLDEHGLRAPVGAAGSIEFESSSPGAHEPALFRRLLAYCDRNT